MTELRSNKSVILRNVSGFNSAIKEKTISKLAPKTKPSSMLFKRNIAKASFFKPDQPTLGCLDSTHYLVPCRTAQTEMCFDARPPNILKDAERNTLWDLLLHLLERFKMFVLSHRVLVIEPCGRIPILSFILRIILCLLSNVLVFILQSSMIPGKLGNKLHLNWKQVNTSLFYCFSFTSSVVMGRQEIYPRQREEKSAS